MSATCGRIAFSRPGSYAQCTSGAAHRHTGASRCSKHSSATKAALMSFTRSMAADFAPLGIRVNALAPGTVDTDMVRANPPEMQRAMAQASHLGRAAGPDEMVGPALFLASDASSFMTGQVLLADGGLVPH